MEVTSDRTGDSKEVTSDNTFIKNYVDSYRVASEGLLNSISELDSLELSDEERKLVDTMKCHANALYEHFSNTKL